MRYPPDDRGHEKKLDGGFMGDFERLFKDGVMALIASLPRNDAALARAAVAGGAHALKVHLNVVHAAGGTRFGTFEEEKDTIAAIIDIARDGGALVGVMPGADTVASTDELKALARMGVCFMDIYEFHVPRGEYLETPGLDAMLAVGHGFSMDTVRRLGADPRVPALEASNIPHESYGAPLTSDDIALYRDIVTAFGGPVAVPSQKNILPEQVSALRGAGVAGIMIGAIVTGKEPDAFEKATAAFRAAIDQL